MWLMIDGNSIAHAAFHAHELGTNNTGSQVPFSVLNALRALIASEFIGFKPIVLWDSQSEYRLSIYPEYKANRKDQTDEQKQKREDFRQQREYLQQALTTLGVTQFRAPGFEADDLAYQFVVSQDKPIVLVTGDRDWLGMLVRDNIAWFCHRADVRRLIRFGQFEQETGVKTVQQFVELKAISGDGSDNIPGIGGLGEKGAKDLLNEHGSFDEFLDWAKQQSKLPTKFKRIIDNQPFEYRGKTVPAPLDTFERNLNLVDLSRCPKIPRENVETTPGRFDQEAFKSIAHTLEFRSILSDLDGWSAPFRGVL
jgi:5'-3' exonuclease